METHEEPPRRHQAPLTFLKKCYMTLLGLGFGFILLFLFLLPRFITPVDYFDSDICRLQRVSANISSVMPFDCRGHRYTAYAVNGYGVYDDAVNQYVYAVNANAPSSVFAYAKTAFNVRYNLDAIFPSILVLFGFFIGSIIVHAVIFWLLGNRVWFRDNILQVVLLAQNIFNSLVLIYPAWICEMLAAYHRYVSLAFKKAGVTLTPSQQDDLISLKGAVFVFQWMLWAWIAFGCISLGILVSWIIRVVRALVASRTRGDEETPPHNEGTTKEEEAFPSQRYDEEIPPAYEPPKDTEPGSQTTNAA
ncbi:MAG: hypothetical protein ABW189_04905 [Rickettsiales bacterium]